MARKTQERDEGKRIYNRVNLVRVETGMSRADLAAQVGVNPQTIGALERGDHYPSLQLAMSICEVFDLPIEAVFSREPFRSITAAYRRTDPTTGDAR
ncbi:helix-turn-helix transcriptional regulator [Nocardioides zeae]|uniref:Helix-turn-helix transcriptional regulator n=1 Tax=Nocardioides imazamoxiresistens TaxID=3231893 RepID=A0ABU3PV53_9ACTN|nr:helix-turn-helix transcriptional regulator [Nocardioides zeae]MDT9593118.1 helix-turn-helix transcriptional regulator [Nocardioides zeae]